MQTALPLRRFSINSIAATFAVLLALTAGGTGGYWLKSQASTAGRRSSAWPTSRTSRTARIANAARAAQTPNSVVFQDDDHGH